MFSSFKSSVNLSRRHCLAAAASLAGAGALGLGTAGNALAQAVKAAAGNKGTQLVLLGTKAARVWAASAPTRPACC